MKQCPDPRYVSQNYVWKIFKYKNIEHCNSSYRKNCLKLFFLVQWGSEYWMCTLFKWLKTGLTTHGSVLRRHLKTGKNFNGLLWRYATNVYLLHPFRFIQLLTIIFHSNLEVYFTSALHWPERHNGTEMYLRQKEIFSIDGLVTLCWIIIQNDFVFGHLFYFFFYS